ncbi:MAG: DUF2207 domain-containing protein [Syntrophaceae bacterium]|nr:DUF2207 domain-containing protein [Syntrophaceae bacterium]
MVGLRLHIINGKWTTNLMFLPLQSIITSAAIIFLFLFSVFSFIPLFSCAAFAEIDDNLKGVPPSSISEWNYYGFSAEESEKWMEQGIIFAGWAAQWRDEGFSAEAAGKWRKITNVYTAGDFLKNGFDAVEGEKWIKNGIRSGLRAREYLEAGLSAEEASSYWEKGIYPNEIKEWRNAGFDVEAMIEWHYGPIESTFFLTKDSPYGRNLYRLEKAIQWRNAGFTAKEMQLSGLYRIDLEEARLWKAAGFTFGEAMRWRDLDFTISEAVSNKNSGLSPVATEFQRYDALEDKPDEINRLDLDITLNKDGSLDVIETAAIIDRPKEFYKKGYYKDLPKQARLWSTRSHGYATKEYSGTTFNIKSVEIDGKAGDYHISKDNLYFGGKDKSLTEGEHLIKITYLTDSRVLYEPHHDELCLGIVENNPKGRYVKNASATIRLPKGAHVIFTDGNGGLEGRTNYISSVEETDKGDVVHFTLTSPLKAGMSFTANVGFIKGYVVESRMHKFIKLDRETGRIITSLTIFAAAFVVLFLYYLIVWFNVGRDPKDTSPVTAEFSPPENMDPAMMRSIHTKGKVDHLSVAAEILYLAENGLIKMSESAGTYKIIKMPAESVKLPFGAKQFYENLWAGIQTELSLTRGKKCDVLSVAAQSLKKLLKNEREKHVVSNSRYLWPGIIFAVLSIAFSLAIIDYNEYDYGKAKIFIPIYTGFLTTAFAILSFIFMRLLRSVTPTYAKLTRRIKSYIDYVALNYAEISISGFVPSFLREHLPYAVAAGLDVDDTTIRKTDTKWYHGTAKDLRCGDFNKMVKKSI